MSSLTVILSSLNCDLKTDTKPSTCPMKLSRSSCNNKELYALPIFIVLNLTGKLHVALDAISKTQQDVFVGKQKSETNYYFILTELTLVSRFKEKRKQYTLVFTLLIKLRVNYM